MDNQHFTEIALEVVRNAEGNKKMVAEQLQINQWRFYKLLDRRIRNWRPSEQHRLLALHKRLIPRVRPIPFIDPRRNKAIGGAELCEKFSSWEIPEHETMVFQRLLPLPLLSDAAVEPHINELVSEQTQYPVVKRCLFQFLCDHADERKKRMSVAKNRTITFMLRSDLERLAYAKPPYADCSPKSSFDFLVDQVEALDFPLCIIDDKFIAHFDKRYGQSTLSFGDGLHTVGLIGGRCVVRRYKNQTVWCSTDSHDVDEAQLFFNLLKRAFALSEEAKSSFLRLKSLASSLQTATYS